MYKTIKTNRNITLKQLPQYITENKCKLSCYNISLLMKLQIKFALHVYLRGSTADDNAFNEESVVC